MILIHFKPITQTVGKTRRLKHFQSSPYTPSGVPYNLHSAPAQRLIQPQMIQSHKDTFT